MAPKMDRLPPLKEVETMDHCQANLLIEVEESLGIVNPVETCGSGCICDNEESLEDISPGDNPGVVNKVTQEEKELKKFYEIETSGLEVAYRCPNCRGCVNCKKGDIFENISLKDEQEQHEIRNSVTLDQENETIWAALPFRTDPDEVLNNNRGIASGYLNKLCHKYDDQVKETITKAIDKLHSRGHILFENEYPQEIKDELQKKVGHYMYYNIAFSDSVSTPVRPVFNASKKTPGGTNLNNCLYRGTPYLTNMLEVTLDWYLDLEAMLGDITQFYNSFKLQLSHLMYQRILYRKDLNPSKTSSKSCKL
jgi:hypothetical protein